MSFPTVLRDSLQIMVPIKDYISIQQKQRLRPYTTHVKGPINKTQKGHRKGQIRTMVQQQYPHDKAPTLFQWKTRLERWQKIHFMVLYSSIWRAHTCKDTIQPIENPPSFQSSSPFVNVIIIFLHYMHSGTILPLDYCTFNGWDRNWRA